MMVYPVCSVVSDTISTLFYVVIQNPFEVTLLVSLHSSTTVNSVSEYTINSLSTTVQ